MFMKANEEDTERLNKTEKNLVKIQAKFDQENRELEKFKNQGGEEFFNLEEGENEEDGAPTPRIEQAKSKFLTPA